MRILFLPRYGQQGASSRYRIWQYLPLFERAGHQVEIQPLMDNRYLEELYKTGHRRAGWFVRGYANRLATILPGKEYDAVVCEQEAVPFLPAWLEQFCYRRSRRLFLDYDDAAYTKYSNWPGLRQKVPRLIATAEAVVVGNEHLAEYARQFSRRVCVIPTVVDLSRYPSEKGSGPKNGVKAVWIGTPVTASLLNPLSPVMEELQSKHPELTFRFIGAGDGFLRNGLRAEVAAWSQATEVKLLSECDIGIMPLTDNEFTRGKCGLKLIQYMACGLPVVASPVGVNRELVEEGRNGFLAATPNEWFEKLDTLIAHPELRARLGAAGRAKVAAGYTLEQGFAQWHEILAGGRVS